MWTCMLDNFVLSIVSWWNIYEQMHLLHGGAPPCSALPICAWLDNCSTGYWVGPWGPIEWPHCDIVCGFGPWTPDAPERQIRDIFIHFFSWLRQLSVCKVLSLLFKSHHNGSEWALKSCSNCMKIIFHNELQSFDVLCILYSHFAKDLD
jgi:hypothetical protein